MTHFQLTAIILDYLNSEYPNKFKIKTAWGVDPAMQPSYDVIWSINHHADALHVTHTYAWLFDSDRRHDHAYDKPLAACPDFFDRIDKCIKAYWL